MSWNVVFGASQTTGADYSLAALLARTEGRVQLDRGLPPLGWSLCDYLFGIAHRNRHTTTVSSVSLRELESRFGRAHDTGEIEATLYELSRTFLEIDQKGFWFSDSVIERNGASSEYRHFAVSRLVRWYWERLDAERDGFAGRDGIKVFNTGAVRVLPHRPMAAYD